MADEFEDFRHENRRVDAAVRSELGSGGKLTHWMWHVFPQRVELGSSHMARMFGIHSLEQAKKVCGRSRIGQDAQGACGDCDAACRVGREGVDGVS